MKKIIHVLFILFTITCKSQTIDIIGSIADSTTKSKLPYGNIILKNNEDSILTNILSNDKGEFIFKNISYQKGMYLLTRYMGYNDKRFDFAFNNDSKINIGVINIIPNATQIKEATIVGNINVVEQKFDKKIFTMNEGKIVAARSVLDLLRTMPGVVVSDDGNIRYKGATATIYVDDQPVENLYPKIEMVPVDKVEKIELIDAAMQTGGSGRGGIINIKLKSIKNDGLSGLVSSKLNSINLENIDKSEEFININYKHKKLTVINNFSYGNNIDNLNSITNQNFNALGVSAIKYFDLNRNDKSDDFNEYIGFVYKSSDNTRINLGGGIYQKKTSVISTLNSFTEIEDKETLNMFSENEFINYNLKYKGFRCSYWHKFDTNDTYLRVFGGLQFINYPSTVNRNYNYTILNSLNTDSIYRTNMQAMEKEDPSVFCSFFYNKSFFKESHWNLSYYFWSFLNNTYTVQYYILDKLFLPQTWSNNYSQQGHYLSWRIGTKIKKWKIDGGINLRDFFVKGNKYFYDITNHDTAIKINNNYLKFLPSATIALTINEAKEVKLTFSKTSDSPYFWDLTDYIDKTDFYNWHTGNSKLKTVDFYSAYLGYTYSKDICNASFECFFNYTNNEVVKLVIPQTSLINLVKPENAAKESNTGIDMSLWLKLNGNFNFSVSSSIFHTFYDTRDITKTAALYDLTTDNLTKKEFGYNMKYNMEYKIKKFYAMFYVNYFSKELTFDGYNKAYINSSINISRKFLKDKLRITLGANNLFDDLAKHISYSNSFGVSSNTEMCDSKYKRLYTFSIQYTIGQGDRETKDLKVN